MTRLPKDWREFIELLNSHQVDYLIVGAFALAFHGHPRSTGDIDILVRPTAENAARIEKVISGFGFASTGLSAQDFQSAGRVVQLGQSPNRIDLITSLSGVDFDEAWDNRVAAEVDSLPLFFIGIEELAKNKRATDRPQDRADLEALGLR